jgi:hypothetical protein
MGDDGVMRPPDLSAFLDGDERVIAWFKAGPGPSWAVWLANVPIDPRTLLLLPLIRLILRVRRYWVVLTDRSILVLRLNTLTGKPRHLDGRLPRRTQLGPFEGRGWIRTGGIRLFAPEVSDKQAVQDADEEMGFPRPVPGIW